MIVSDAPGKQLKAARALVGWSVRDLEEETGVTIKTISRIENGNDFRSSTFDKLIKALEQSGIEFIPETPTSGPGVRLKKEAQ